jgi:predicted TIM-barrel fold metal-dependent hydrolase
MTSTIDAANEWRLETPGTEGWTRTARPDDPDKYFMVSTDCHANEPLDWLDQRIEPEYRERIPHLEVDDDGEKWLITEGWRPQRFSTNKAQNTMAAEDLERARAGASNERLRDNDRDGVDVEVVFPNKGLLLWATPDAEFAMAMARAWNRWALEELIPLGHRVMPMACLSPGDKEGSLAEIEWATDNGFLGTALPCKPVWGAPDADQPNYNQREFDWLWSALSEANLPATFHISTGRDPRAARGEGGAVVNYVAHAMSPAMEPVASLCGSGVCERFPDLQFATIEAGIGWVPWALEAMDEAHRKHHMWAFPRLPMLPSEYYRRQGFSSFQEDAAGLRFAEEFDLVENFLWANDYPHHEGSWPHSAPAIERQLAHLTDDSKAKILGLNAARLFDLNPADFGR